MSEHGGEDVGLAMGKGKTNTSQSQQETAAHRFRLDRH